MNEFFIGFELASDNKRYDKEAFKGSPEATAVAEATDAEASKQRQFADKVLQKMRGGEKPDIDYKQTTVNDILNSGLDLANTAVKAASQDFEIVEIDELGVEVASLNATPKTTQELGKNALGHGQIN